MSGIVINIKGLVITMVFLVLLVIAFSPLKYAADWVSFEFNVPNYFSIIINALLILIVLIVLILIVVMLYNRYTT